MVHDKNTTINGQVYLSILLEKLIPHMNIHGCTVFQHDGASCHRAGPVKHWLSKQDIEVLQPWPGSSPDLNPIKNRCLNMKQKLSNMNPTSEADLTAAIKKFGQKI